MIDWTSWMDYGFMKMALAAILIITPLFGLMGTMIVNKKMACFFCDTEFYDEFQISQPKPLSGHRDKKGTYTETNLSPIIRP